MRNIYIVGYMASGKTTFGRALAKRLGREFTDLDEAVERKFGMPVAEIIGRHGIDFFRREEKEALTTTLTPTGHIIACGGGTPCHFDNMERMNASGLTLWLKASPERTAIRVLAAGPTRPLLRGISPEQLPDYIARHLEERLPYYRLAKIEFSGEHLEDEAQIEKAVDDFIKILSDSGELPKGE